MPLTLIHYQSAVEAEGFFKPSIPHTVKRVAEIIVLHAIGFYLLFNGRVAAGLCKKLLPKLFLSNPLYDDTLYHFSDDANLKLR